MNCIIYYIVATLLLVPLPAKTMRTKDSFDPHFYQPYTHELQRETAHYQLIGAQLSKLQKRKILNVLEAKQNKQLYESAQLIKIHEELLEAPEQPTHLFILGEYYGLVRILEERKQYNLAFQAIESIEPLLSKNKEFEEIFKKLKTIIESERKHSALKIY